VLRVIGAGLLFCPLRILRVNCKVDTVADAAIAKLLEKPVYNADNRFVIVYLFTIHANTCHQGIHFSSPSLFRLGWLTDCLQECPVTCSTHSNKPSGTSLTPTFISSVITQNAATLSPPSDT
jgi:hypothetical protein